MAANQNASKSEFEKKREELEKVFHPISAKLYGQGQPGPQGNQGFPGADQHQYQ